MSLASLAAYASSDESESDQEESSTLNTKQSSGVAGPSVSSASSSSSAPSTQVISAVDLIDDEDDHLMSHASVTSSLPESEEREDSVTGNIFQANDVVDDVPLANKITAEKPPKKGQKVKISIPSLSQFKDDDDEGEPAAKKIKPSAKGSGLFSLLPPPKAATIKEMGRALLPQSVSRPAPARRAAAVPAVRRVPAPAPAPAASQPAAPDSDEEEDGGDFFSLSEDGPALPSLPAAPAAGPLTFSEREQEAAAAAQRRPPTPEPMDEAPQPTAAGSQWPPQPDAAAQMAMQAEALQHLSGRRGRRQAAEEIHFIDVNQDDILPDRDEWMTKQLTEEKVVRRPQKSNDDPTTQQRRKHQITYLAHQAKEREVELKNEWAQNKATKDAYRTKYGF